MPNLQVGFAFGGIVAVLAVVVLALTGHCTANVGPFGIH